MSEDATRFTRAKSMECPHCGGTVSVAFNIEMTGDLRPVTAGPVVPAVSTKEPSRTADEQAVLDQATSNGLLQAFMEALRGGRPAEELPKDPSALFLLFFKKATPKNVPRVCLEHFIREFRPAQVEVWGAEGVAAVLADRRVKAFIPYKLVRGAQVKSLTGGSKARMDIDEQAFFSWVRTKHGYVPSGGGVFFQAMQQKSRGEFARLVQ